MKYKQVNSRYQLMFQQFFSVFLNYVVSCREIKKITVLKYQPDKITYQKSTKFIYLGAIFLVEIVYIDTHKKLCRHHDII